MPINNENINKLTVPKKVLVAPLDWGLGHATRCIPIINEFLLQGFEVIIAAEDKVAALLDIEFSQLKIISLKGYRISYSKLKLFFLWKMICQIPKIFFAIKDEKRWLKEIIEKHKIDIVLSDNRFGLYHKNVHCIFITHQLNIKTGNRFTDKIAQKINYAYINKFNECWVIDEAGANNLAGTLSHPEKKPTIKTTYISALSRFQIAAANKTIDLLIVLSGPEPQRTIFENILIAQIKGLTISTTLVRGLPSEHRIIKNENRHLTILNYCNANDLNKIVLSSKTIISRSGYTSVMDYAVLQQKVIYVPTPGQTEQLYLAKYLSQKMYGVMQLQQDFDVKIALNIIENTTLIPYPAFSERALKEAINHLL